MLLLSVLSTRRCTNTTKPKKRVHAFNSRQERFSFSKRIWVMSAFLEELKEKKEFLSHVYFSKYIKHYNKCNSVCICCCDTGSTVKSGFNEHCLPPTYQHYISYLNLTNKMQIIPGFNKQFLVFFCKIFSLFS